MFFDTYRQLCFKAEKSPNGVAKELGFPSSSVTQWKKGSTPRPAALRKIADYFGVSVDVFLTSTETKKEPATNGDELDATTKELRDIWESADEDERKALLEMARLIKKRRG